MNPVVTIQLPDKAGTRVSAEVEAVEFSFHRRTRRVACHCQPRCSATHRKAYGPLTMRLRASGVTAHWSKGLE